MGLRCLLGLHDWETESFGAGYPARECRRCHRCEVKPIGSPYYFKTGEGATLESIRHLHNWHDKINRGDFSEEAEGLNRSFNQRMNKDD